MDDYCCDECSYWEDRADINTENEIKMTPRKIEGDNIIAIPKLNTTIMKDLENNKAFSRLTGLPPRFTPLSTQNINPIFCIIGDDIGKFK